MGVPTITTISPSDGQASGGDLIVIQGTNYRLPTQSMYGVPVYHPPVEVLFGGVTAERVDVISTTRLHVLTPYFVGSPEVDLYTPVNIVVRNIDDNGDLIPGESITVVAAFTFRRASLRPPSQALESPSIRIMKELLQRLKRQIILTVDFMVSPDYSYDGLELFHVRVPSLSITSWALVKDAYGEENELIEATIGGVDYVFPAPTMRTIRGELEGHTDSHLESIRLAERVEAFFIRNCKLSILGDAPPVTLHMPMLATRPPYAVRNLLDAKVHTFAVEFEIRRIPMLYLPPGLITQQISSIILQAQKMNGVLVETISL